MPITAESLPIAFEVLRERLRQENFRLSVDDQLRLQQLLELAGPSVEPAQLKTLLCPIFAANSAQQSRFYEIFDQVFLGLAEAERKRPTPAGADLQKPAPAPPKTVA